MIHDQSSTGSTLFVEPMAIVKLNNDLKELAMKEQEEIRGHPGFPVRNGSPVRRHDLTTITPC